MFKKFFFSILTLLLQNTSTIFDHSAKHGKIDADPVLYVTPDYLSSISLGVTTLIGKVKSSKKRREDPVAMIIAYDKLSKKELWKTLKDYSSFVTLDATLRPKIDTLPKLPERSLFQSHAPSKVDVRKLALEEYLFTILKSDLLDFQTGFEFCKFLSSDIVDPLDSLDSPHHKEGYLTMRTLLGWKMRYFVITDTQLEYFDKPGGELQGSITLKGAMIGRQTSKNDHEGNSDEQSEKGFRHAFLLADHKKKDQVRHVLCAESDEERDLWIKTLLEVISQPESPNQSSDSPSKNSPEHISKSFNTTSSLVSPGPESILSKNSTVSFSTMGTQPISNTSTLSSSAPREFTTGPKIPNRNVRHSVIPSAFGQTTFNSVPLGSNTFNVTQRLKTKSSVESTSNGLRPSVSLEEEYETPGKLTKKKKGKGFFSSFRNRGSSSNHNHSVSVSANSSFDKFQATPYSAVEQKTFSANAVVNPNPSRDDVAGMQALGVSLDEAIRSQSDAQCLPHFDKTLIEGGPNHIGNRLFGIPLSDALKLSSKVVYNCTIPSIIYRCIELLKVRGAIFEEGIFRLNGSTSTIRSLKERFNKEYDIDLVKSETFYDIHAVAGLLKLYLREMPIIILSQALSAEFRVAIDIQNTKVRVSKLNSLVKRLPKENRDLLCVLCSLLTEVISHSDVNKMNLRNVGIVFALTLNISASVLINFLTEFDDIFGGESAMPGEPAAVNLSRRVPLQSQPVSRLSFGPGSIGTTTTTITTEAARRKENNLPGTAVATASSPSSPSSLMSLSASVPNAKSDESQFTGIGVVTTTPLAVESNP